MKSKIPKIPKIRIDTKGRRYILIQKKKVLLAKNNSERELIIFIISRLAKNKTKKGKSTGKSGDTSSSSKTYDVLPQQEREPVPSAVSNMAYMYPPVYTDPRALSTVEEKLTPAVVEKTLKEQLQD